MPNIIMADQPSGQSPVQITEYTHAEDWTTDANGNTQNFANTYFLGNGWFYAKITNNSVSGNYKAIEAVAQKNFLSTNVTGQFRRASGISNQLSTSASFYISAGAKITVKFIPATDIKE